MLNYSVDPGVGGSRRAYWNQAMRDVYGPDWSLVPARPADFKMHMQAVKIGIFTVSRASLSQAEVKTRPGNRRPAASRPYNIYVVDRAQQVEMGGQSLILEPGDFMLADSALASTIVTDEPYTTIGITVPANFLRARVAAPDRAVGVRFSGAAGPSKAVSGMLLEMWKLAERGDFADVGNRLIVSLIDLFSVCCDLECSSRTTTSTCTWVRRAQIKEVIQTHLSDSEFTVAALGREVGLSTRYMQMLFAESGESICQYILKQRLEACRAQLADAANHGLSVTDIAFRCGFNSAAYFCRAFRAQYNMTPSGFRAQSARPALT